MAENMDIQTPTVTDVLEQLDKANDHLTKCIEDSKAAISAMDSARERVHIAEDAVGKAEADRHNLYIQAGEMMGFSGNKVNPDARRGMKHEGE